MQNYHSICKIIPTHIRVSLFMQHLTKQSYRIKITLTDLSNCIRTRHCEAFATAIQSLIIIIVLLVNYRSEDIDL